MVTNPIAFAIATFFAIVTLAPKRPGFGESAKDYIATMAGAIVAAISLVFAFSPG
ncbi:MAG: hypothetical protein J0I29_02255 [Rhizobiales bacterium]|nr:hypothetical protein [Hyphomicrobiales bacterium]